MNRKKLIEVALPLNAINKAAAREKSIRHGHPSTLHLWWARRPLAAARAVIFAQMVDDPSSRPELFPTEAEQDAERARLFDLIERLVQWKNTTNEALLDEARTEIKESWRRTCADHEAEPDATDRFDPDRLPAFHDPFAGGGALPLEAQRLGLEVHASDLNPVAVLINKAMIEIPPKFVDCPPVNPAWRSTQDEQKKLTIWSGTTGLAEDVRYYGRWMRKEAQRRIGTVYPTICISETMVAARPELGKYEGQHLKIIAWIWARTVRSPNPAFADSMVPLVSSFWLSKKTGKEAWVELVLRDRHWDFYVRTGQPDDPDALARGTKIGGSRSPFFCVFSKIPIPFAHIRDELRRKQSTPRLMAIVAEGNRERVYLNPDVSQEQLAQYALPTNTPMLELPPKALGFRVQQYGMYLWRDLYTPRQLVTLCTLSDLVVTAWHEIQRDAMDASIAGNEGIVDARSYADAVALYLALGASKTANRASTLCTWKTGVQCPGDTFGRQALPMSWDYAEANSLSGPSGSFMSMIDNTAAGLVSIKSSRNAIGNATDADARTVAPIRNSVISTDPPYYDNIGYADLSDFFYVWLRRALQHQYPMLFMGMGTPKTNELISSPFRQKNRKEAEDFFLEGMIQAMTQLARHCHPAFPVTIYYAFKQSEKTDDGGQTSTAWETFLEAVIRSGFNITGTWPIRTERQNRKVGQGTNALASSVVIVCRKRRHDADIVTRRKFRKILAADLKSTIRPLQDGNIAPVDLAQAAIGPGMAIYSRYTKVVSPDGSTVSVRRALQYINEALDMALGADFDRETRWALAWFETHGFDEGKFGVAEVLAKAKNTSVKGLVERCVAESRGGTVRLIQPEEMNELCRSDYVNASVWQRTQLVLRAYAVSGDIGAAEVLARFGEIDNGIRDLAYRCYVICERKRWAETAFAYNALVSSWPEIVLQSRLKPWLRESEPELGLKGDG